MSKAIVTAEERAVLEKILAPFASKIARVSIFGSRATGRARPSSDIDLVVYGDLDSKSERRLWTDFEDSNLPVSVDLTVYERIKNPLLKEHIDAVSVQLFTQSDLKKKSKSLAGR